MNSTQAFLGEPATWLETQVQPLNLHPLWGGHEITNWDSGRVIMRTADRGGCEHTNEFNAPESVRALIQSLIEVDFVTIEIEPRNGIPDEARPEIGVTNDKNEQHRISKWAGQNIERFDRIHNSLLELKHQAP